MIVINSREEVGPNTVSQTMQMETDVNFHAQMKDFLSPHARPPDVPISPFKQLGRDLGQLECSCSILEGLLTNKKPVDDMLEDKEIKSNSSFEAVAYCDPYLRV